ncbi:hypothetical protein F7234_09390 [Pseudomonas putida]|nr:hypothetical protein F7234_09390 [Pseudomonas putida]
MIGGCPLSALSVIAFERSPFIHIQPCAKAAGTDGNRRNWPETNVGAAVRRSDLPAKRRAGGA